MTLSVETGAPNIRFAGMLIAVAVSFGIVLLPLDRLAPNSFLSELGALGLLGAPLAGLLGWWFTKTVVEGSWRNALGFGALMGALAAYLGVLEFAYIALISALGGLNPVTGFGDDLTGVLFFATYGLPYGTLVLPVTIPCGLVWAVIVRGILRRAPGAMIVGPSPMGVTHVAIVLLVVAIGAALIPVAQSR